MEHSDLHKIHLVENIVSYAPYLSGHKEVLTSYIDLVILDAEDLLEMLEELDEVLR